MRIAAFVLRSTSRSVLAAAGVAVLLATGAPAQAQLSERVHINGYSSFEWEYQLSDHEQGKGDKNGSFDADLFDLVINVEPVDRLRVAADLTWEHGAATEDGRGNVAVEYAFSEYTVHDALKLRAGKMFVPFGIYNEIHTAKPAFIPADEPLSTNKPDKLGAPGRLYQRWGAGLEAVGRFHLGRANADYSLLLFNGESEQVNPFEEDDNASKAVAARLRVEPHPTLKLGLSAYRDVQNVYDSEGAETDDHVTNAAFGASLEWSLREVNVELEGVRGWIPSGGTARTETLGLSALLSRRFGAHATPYLAAQYLDPDQDASDDAALLFIAGVNVRVSSNLFLKAEIDRYSSQDANPRFKGVGFTQANAAIVVGF